MQRLRVLVGPSMEAPGTQSDESGLELEFSGYLSQRRSSCRITFYRLLGANYCYLLHLALRLPSSVQLYPEYIQAARYRCSVFRFSSK